MKKARQIFSVLVAMVMVLGMCTIALAKSPDGKVTVSGIQSGDNVGLYKVIGWSDAQGWQFVAPFTDLTNAEKQRILEDKTINAELAEKIAEKASSPTQSIEATSDSIEATVDPGLYLVLVTPTTDSSVIYNPAFVANDYDTGGNAIDMASNYGEHTIPKKDTVTVTKTVPDESYSLGDKLPFTVTTTIPRYPSNSTNATFTVGDAPVGMTIDTATVVVKVGEEVIHDKNTSIGNNGTADVSGSSITVAFAKDYVLAHGGETVTITYEATLTEVSDVDGTATNTATVTYSQNPFNGGTNDVDTTVTVKTYGIVLEKKDDSGNALAGAVFDLYNEAGTKITGENGNFLTATTTIVNGRAYVSWAGLKAGTYTVKETTPPTGYAKVEDFPITVNDNTANTDNPATADVIETNFNASYTDTAALEDAEGTNLPSTGGIGTTIFYIVGGVMVAGAAIFLLTKRRASAAE